MSRDRSNVVEFDSAGARARAAKVVERWRGQGFDTLVCNPSGYCMPANSGVLRSPLPPGYAACPLASAGAVAAVAASIERGTVYRVA